MSETPTKLASFTPVTITAETIGVLRQQKHFADLLALYMAYAEVAVWQKTTTVKATGRFMQQRMHWGENKFVERKGTLRKLGLIEDDTRKDDKGKATGWFVKVNYVVNSNNIHPHDLPLGGLDHWVDSGGTSAVNTKVSAIDPNLSTIPKAPEDLTSNKSKDSLEGSQTPVPTGLLKVKKANPMAIGEQVEKTSYGDADFEYVLRQNDLHYLTNTLMGIFGYQIVQDDIPTLKAAVRSVGKTWLLQIIRDYKNGAPCQGDLLNDGLASWLEANALTEAVEGG